jgi:hypothetical protein
MCTRLLHRPLLLPLLLPQRPQCLWQPSRHTTTHRRHLLLRLPLPLLLLGQPLLGLLHTLLLLVLSALYELRIKPFL